jgi:phosphate-selective porin OprO/OprP
MRNRQTKLLTALLMGAIVGTQPAVPTLRAEDTNTIQLIKQLQRRIEELEQKVQVLEHGKGPGEAASDAKAKERLEALDQKVKVLEREKELDQEASEAKAKEAPKISIGGDGFNLRSAKGDFAVQLKGVLQMDSRTFFNDPAVVGNDSLLLRRVRPILQGTVFRDFDFLFVPDFAPTSGPQIFDAYVNYKYSPELQFQAGKYKVPIGLEQLVLDKDTLFNERSLVTALVPNRDVGFEVHGNLFDGRMTYGAGIFNGTSDGANTGNVDFAGDQAYVGRLFFQPFEKASVAALQGFGFGVAGGYETTSTTNTAGLPATTGGNLRV